MTMRELWLEIMYYGEFDRMPVIHWTGWTETMERWHEEGMPEGVNAHEYFDTVPHWAGVGGNLSLLPAFEAETIEETEEYRIFRAGDGVVQKDWKNRSCIPQYIDYTLKTAADWPEFKKRLQPDPGRIWQTMDESIRNAEESGLPVVLGTASMMGWIRNWMGVENMSFLMYDDPDCYADMVMTLADLTCWFIDQVVPRMSRKPDMGFGWEDICGKSGPLVSPQIFEKCVAAGYRKMRDKLEEHDIDLLGIDTDGMIEPMTRNWLDAGVNVQFPVEYGTWKARPEDFRKKYGRELRIVGGYNKLVLEQGRPAIDAELESHIPLMKEGGFIIMPDHLITPGVPLEDYKYYLEQVRQLRF
jgi:uroporphyrinogen decarboxylase